MLLPSLALSSAIPPPSFLAIRPDDLEEQQVLLQFVKDLGNKPLDNVEAYFVARAMAMENDKKVDRLNEALVANMICGVLFEFPRMPAKDAAVSSSVRGVSFIASKKFRDDELIEPILPLFRNEHGQYSLRCLFAGYSGPTPDSEYGLKLFRRCRSTLPVRRHTASQ
jgi:hypothetical protein